MDFGMTLLLALARLTAGLFAGTCLYVAAVGLPARASLPPAEALAHFRSSLARSARMQPALHAPSLIACAAACAISGSGTLTVALLALAPVLPISLGLARPVYRRLSAPGLDPASPEAEGLMARFAEVHALRTGLAILGFALLAVA